MLSKILCLLALVSGAALAPSRAQVFTPTPAPGATGGPFTHPGIFSSQNELETIRRRLAAHAPNDPMVTGWQSVMTSRYADLNYRPEPVAIVTRADKSPTPVHERDSAMVAYVMALRWVLAGDEAARAKAVSVMNAWADVFQDHEGDVNTHLDAAWVVTVWSAAGELMRHGRYQGRAANWPTDQVEKFSTMIRRLEAQSSHILTDAQWKGHTGNWDSSAMLGDMAAGVFLDDRAMYERGRNMVLEFMPRMLHQEGWPSEVFRDPWHCGVTLTGIIEAAEIARHQGNDTSLYEARYDGQNDPRIVVSLHWDANPLRGIPSGPLPAFNIGPAYLHKTAGWQYDAKGATRNTGAFEMALNYYARIAHRPDLDDLKDVVLHYYRPSGQDNSLYITSDSLTHADLN